MDQAMAPPVRTPRSTWISAGLRALAAGGPDAVRIEPLAQALGVTRGGFYWHFDNRRAFLDELLGWDDPGDGLGARVPTLRDRLPADLRDTAAAAPRSALPFVPLYLTDREAALEIANRTMHGVLHLGWVADGESGGYRGQMAISSSATACSGRRTWRRSRRSATCSSTRRCCGRSAARGARRSAAPSCRTGDARSTANRKSG